MFDGEGVIMISKSSPRGRYKSPLYRLVVSMTNTNLEVLQFAQKHYGGHIGGPYVRGERWRPSYRWELDDNDTLDFLRDIGPYTQIKGEHIEVALEFRDRVLNSRTESLGKAHGSRPMSEGEAEAREASYQRMKDLNYRGLPLDE